MATPNRPICHSKSLRPPQFGLRTLLGLIAAIAVLLSLRQWISPIAIAALAFLAASVFLHVAGNAIGTRLRQIGDLPDARVEQLFPPARRPPQQEFAPTHLSRRSSLGWMIIAASSIGTASGAVGGGLWTFAASRGHVGAINIVVGVIAFAVLGGMAAFATFAFAQVLSAALWQAMTASSAVGEADENAK